MKDAELDDSAGLDESSNRVSLFSDFHITECGLDFEKQAWAEGFKFVAGLDEVGRGCIAGPVVAAACILSPDKAIPKGIDDSKKLTAARRDEIAEELKEICIAYAIGSVEAEEIDRINILEATKKSMLNALDILTPKADYLLIDALRLKQASLPQKAIIKGDTVSASIAAASILAKTYRDALMVEYDTEFPQYGFAGHKGYGAVTHFAAIRAHGACRLHRKTFRGVV